VKLSEGSELGGHYKILKALGEGGYGSVYHAVDLNLNREVALKVLKPNAVETEADLKRIKRECIILARLDHPNIVRIYSFEMIEDVPVIAMEYVPGETLASKLLDHKALDYQACKSILQQICQGLSHAHHAGIIHRDLSSLNVLLGGEMSNPKVKLIDFGLSKLLAPELENNSGKEFSTMALTKTRNLVGNPFYMSPEACRGEKLDAKTDIYSLACVLYEMMSGKRLFESADPLAVLYMQQSQYPAPPDASWDKKQKQEILQLLWHCLQKDKEKRPASADAIIAFLEGSAQLPELEANRQWSAVIRARRDMSGARAVIGSLAIVLIIALATLVMTKKSAERSDAVALEEKNKYGKFAGIKSIERQMKNVEAKERLFGKGSRQMIGPLQALGIAYRDNNFQEESAACLKEAYQIALREKNYDQGILILIDLVRDAPPVKKEQYANEALAILKEAGREDSGQFLEILGQLAISYRLQGKLDQAEQLQERRLKIAGERADIFLELGKIYNAKSKDGPAIAALKKAIRLSSIKGQEMLEGFAVRQYSELELAAIYFKEKKFAESEKLFRDIKDMLDSSSLEEQRKLNDTSAALIGIAECEFARGNYTSAIKDYRQAIELMDRANFQKRYPVYWQAHKQLAESLVADGKTAEGELEYKNVVASCPCSDASYSEAIKGLANLYEKQGKLSQAESLRKKSPK
jgi:tRNA A-37 threonylcarbamoyl transferase component Bud32/tetratricopeptide (TPR) repeat protein